MTVKELIDHLKTLDPDYVVIVPPDASEISDVWINEEANEVLLS